MLKISLIPSVLAIFSVEGPSVEGLRVYLGRVRGHILPAIPSLLMSSKTVISNTVIPQNIAAKVEKKITTRNEFLTSSIKVG